MSMNTLADRFFFCCLLAAFAVWGSATGREKRAAGESANANVVNGWECEATDKTCAIKRSSALATLTVIADRLPKSSLKKIQFPYEAKMIKREPMIRFDDSPQPELRIRDLAILKWDCSKCKATFAADRGGTIVFTIAGISLAVSGASWCVKTVSKEQSDEKPGGTFSSIISDATVTIPARISIDEAASKAVAKVQHGCKATYGSVETAQSHQPEGVSLSDKDILQTYKASLTKAACDISAEMVNAAITAIDAKTLEGLKLFAAGHEYTVMLSTWNVESMTPKNDADFLKPWLLPDKLSQGKLPDFIITSVQEVININNPARLAEAESALQVEKLADYAKGSNVATSANTNGNQKSWTEMTAADVGKSVLTKGGELVKYYMNTNPDAWHQAIMSTINGKDGKDEPYKLVAKQQVLGILMMVYAKKTVFGELSGIAKTFLRQGVGIGGNAKVGNKGAVTISFVLRDTSVVFVGPHLEADHKPETWTRDWKQRDDDFKELNDKLSLEPLDAVEYKDKSRHRLVKDHDLVFFGGDLNYRMMDRPDGKFPGLASRKALQEYLDVYDYDGLMSYDQLSRSRKAQMTHESAKERMKNFEGFVEGRVEFEPTFRYIVGSHGLSMKRFPSYCDRILWKLKQSKDKSGQSIAVSQEFYKSIPAYTLSDHKPIHSFFTINIPFAK